MVTSNDPWKRLIAGKVPVFDDLLIMRQSGARPGEWVPASAEAQLGFPAHSHMLRHACGYYLASQGHDTRAIQVWMGHRNIQHTVRYTELAPDRFKSFWKEDGAD
jgi:integrase